MARRIDQPLTPASAIVSTGVRARQLIVERRDRIRVHSAAIGAGHGIS
jgi:hypothetical protein